MGEWPGCEEGLEQGTKKVIGMFTVLVVVMVSQVPTFIKTYH